MNFLWQDYLAVASEWLTIATNSNYPQVVYRSVISRAYYIDKRGGIVNDPNNSDNPQAIVRLIGQVITVSLATVQVVHQLPPLWLIG